MPYVALLALIILGFIIIKRVAGCLVRVVIIIILVAAFAFIYFKFFRGELPLGLPFELPF